MNILIFIFLAVIAPYAYFIHFIGLESWNVSSRLNLTYALAEGGTFRVDAYHRNTGDKVYYRGHYYSDKAPGISFLAVPFYFLLKWSGLNSEKYMRYGLTLLVVGLPSALAALLFYEILRMLKVAKQWSRVILTFAYALGTQAFPFSTVFYGHQMAAALGIAVFFILLRLRVGIWPERMSTLWLAGFLGGWALISDYPAAIVIVILSGYCLSFLKKKERIVGWVVGLAFPIALLMYYNYQCFGRLLFNTYAYHVTYDHQAGWGGVSWPRLRALWGITFSSYRGVFYGSPFLICAFPGIYFLFRRKKFRKEVYCCLLIVLGFLIFNSGYTHWDGVGSTGARFLIPCLPFLVLLVSGVIERWPKPVEMLAVISMMLMLAVAATEPRAEWKVHSPLLYFNIFLLFRGYLSENLGTMMGLKGGASLIPLVALLLADGILLYRLIPGRERTIWSRKGIKNAIGVTGIAALWLLIAGWEEPVLREYDKAESLFRYYRGRGFIKWDEIERHYHQALALDPRFMEPYLRLAEIARLKGRPEVALRYYDELLQRGAQPVILRQEKALVYELLGERERAEAMLKEALAIAPTDVSVHNQLADFYWRNNQAKEAIRQWEESLRLNSKDRRIRLKLENLRQQDN